MHLAGTRALLKIVWLNSSGVTINPVPANQDTNLVGSVETGQYGGVVSQIEMSGASPQNAWTFMESRATCPAGATQIQAFCILVTGSSGPTETVYFDDVIAFQPVGFAGWANLGPVWLGNSNTNQVVDLIGTTALLLPKQNVADGVTDGIDGGRDMARWVPVSERNNGPDEIHEASKEQNRESAWQKWSCSGVHLD